jgi:Domain of unknown function (DUF397)
MLIRCDPQKQRTHTMNPEIVGEFRMSSFSGDQPNRVETAPTAGGGRAVRDSEDPDGPRQFYSAAEWAALVAGVKNGEFDA